MKQQTQINFSYLLFAVIVIIIALSSCSKYNYGCPSTQLPEFKKSYKGKTY